jgi:hypothetical protein
MVVICFVIVTMIMEASIPDISVFAGEVIPSRFDVTIFTIMTLIYAFDQFVILRFVKQTGQSVKSRMLRVVHTSVSVIQLFLILILMFIVTQMVIFSRYDILFMNLVILTSCITSILLLGILAKKFLSWFRSNRNLTVFLYSLAIVLLSINAAFIILDVTSSLTRFGQNDYIQPSIGKVANVALLSIDDVFHFGYVITSILSFILMWIATVVLLYHHSTKLGRIKYWIVVTIPLVYFLSEFQSYFIDLLAPFRLSDPILFGIAYTLFFSATRPIGGLLFGIAFWSIARRIRGHAVKDYMTISAYGVILIFSSIQITSLILAHYPPFGLASISFLGLGSYLLLVGIYSSAISVANDTNLRRSMRQTMERESAMLDNIATSQMETEIQNRITTIARHFSAETRYVFEKTGVEPSLQEDEIKEYLKLTLQEIENSKKPIK